MPCPRRFSPRQAVRVLGQALGNRRLLLFLCAAALLTEAHQTITVFLSQLQYARCGLSESAMGLLYLAAAVLTDSVGVGTNLAFGALAEAGLSLAFWFGGGLCLTGLLLFFLWYRPRHRG